MNRSQHFNGQIVLEIICANHITLLNALNNEKINLQNVTYCDDLTFLLTISHNDYESAMSIVDKLGASAKIIKKQGIYWNIIKILKRPVLLIFICTMLLLAFYLPSRVLFISIEGNVAIPTHRILEAAEECGIRFGASRRLVRSETMKNALLQKIPQLQWAGINTSGCTAVISVKEKTTQKIINDTKGQVSSIVAARDGVIQTITVIQGNPLCTAGQAVKAGQTLVSGYLNLGIVTKTTQAKAEINALTFRELEAVTLKPESVRGNLIKKKTYYSLRIGKKLLNFTKDSGILDTTCAKIYSENYLLLPGGFSLPIAIVKQTQLYYDTLPDTATASDTEHWLTEFAKKHLQQSMVAGQIISAKTEFEDVNDAKYFYGEYACLEMIGQVKFENTLKDGEND